jgi:DHA2 family multidrug resistance protein
VSIEAEAGYPDPFRRLLMTIPMMLAGTMVAIDITIANVALPHMQATVGASPEQIIWVLTSYLIAGAIATPLSGWLAGRFGRKRVMLISAAGFTAASALCGASNSLEMLVLARALQGASGASLMPLSQAILLDINPPENYAKAMAIFSLGSMAGPIVGPTVGGWLTDTLSWRWVFFINIPFGILAFLGMLAFLYESRNENRTRFDLFGFLTVSAALAAFQLMIDLGEHLDWFDSTEIWIYAMIVGVSVYLTIVHICTARNTFINPALFRDRNFTIGGVIGVLLGIAVFATVPMIVIMTQSLLGYSAFRTGMVGMPRALGTLVAMLVVTRLVEKFDTRLILAVGLAISALSMLMYSHMDLYVDERALIVTGFVQGLAGGLIFVPLSVLVFSTLPKTLRNEGASMNSLVRNIGNAVGISYLQREFVHLTAGARAHLVEGVRPDSPALQYARPDFDFGSSEALAGINQEVARQASMVGNVEMYRLVFVISLLMIPLILFLRESRRQRRDEALPLME